MTEQAPERTGLSKLLGENETEQASERTSRDFTAEQAPLRERVCQARARSNCNFMITKVALPAVAAAEEAAATIDDEALRLACEAADSEESPARVGPMRHGEGGWPSHEARERRRYLADQRDSQQETFPPTMLPAEELIADRV